MARVFVVSPAAVLALTIMDPFSESEWFDDDPSADSLPGASPSSPGEQASPPAPSAPAPAVTIAEWLAARWLVCLAGVLIVLLLAVVVVELSYPHPRPQAHATRAHHHYAGPRRLHRRRHITYVVRPSSGAPPTVVKRPSQPVGRPSGVRPVGSERPVAAGQVGNTEQFAYLGR